MKSFKQIGIKSSELAALNNMRCEWLFLLQLNNITTFQELSMEFGSDLLEKMTRKSIEVQLCAELPNLNQIYEWIEETSHLDF